MTALSIPRSPPCSGVFIVVVRTAMGLPSHPSLSPSVAKMASHAIFQYNVLVIDIDNTTLGLI